MQGICQLGRTTISHGCNSYSISSDANYMLEEECEEFGLARIKNLVFSGSSKTIYSGWRQRDRGRMYLISEIPPSLSTEPITSII